MLEEMIAGDGGEGDGLVKGAGELVGEGGVAA